VRKLAAAAAVFLTLAAPATAAAAACPRTSVADVEPEVMCIECGVPLDVAGDAPTAKRERAFINQLISQCRTKDQIKAALAGQFGDRVLASPKSKGFGLTAWAVPAVAFLAACALIAASALRWRRNRSRSARRAGTPDAPDPPLTVPPSPDSARLDADLRRYDL
jgi:cytochrome c-type biogenesis protein CcmH